MNISHELLISKGFEYKPVARSDGWPDFDEYKFIMQNADKTFWVVEFRHNMSNTVNRDWGIHIDNCVYESVAYVDVQTVEHANKLFEVMDIEYRL